MAFAITFTIVFIVYLSTLSSDVDLESSGIYATAAMHAGVGCPPGYPQWTLLTWLFIHSIPFGNIAWRISLISALEGALASGLIAFIGCRTATIVVKQLRDDLATKDLFAITLVSSNVAAMAFAFSTDFWARAITVDVQAFDTLLFCFALVLMLRWILNPNTRAPLYTAFFFYGLTISSGQSFISTALGMQYLVVAGDRMLGRDLLLVNGLLLLAGLALAHFGLFPLLQSAVLTIYLLVTAITLISATILIALTRRVFTCYKQVLIACALLTIATLTYFIVPILSMTNPPVNWSYPRTVEGFFHLLTRGQFERLNPTPSALRLMQQLKMFVGLAFDDFGWYYLIFAVSSLFILKRVSENARAWLIGLWILFASTTLLMIDVMNPSLDRQTLGLLKTYFTQSYVVLAILTAIGLVNAAAVLTKPHRKNEVKQAQG